MANAVIPRMQGDDYQARFFWLEACRLFQPHTNVCRVAFELSSVKGFDDLATFYDPPVLDERGKPVRADYFQIKFHVDHAGGFTWQALLDPDFVNASSISLLQRLHAAVSLFAPDGNGCRFHVLAPWPVHPEDALARLVSNQGGELRLNLLFDGKSRSQMAKIRKAWREHLGLAADAELERVLRPLRIQTQTGTLDALRGRLDDLFASVGLRPVGGACQSHPYDDLVRKARTAGQSEFTRGDVEEICRREGLWMGQPPPRPVDAATVVPDEITPQLASIKQTVESIDEQLRTRYSRVEVPAAEEGPAEPPSASALAALPAAGQSPQVRVLMTRIGVLEDRDRRHLDDKGQRLWQNIQQSVRDLDLREAVRSGKALAAWLADEGRKASAGVRGRAAILLADLAIIDMSQRLGDERVDTQAARRWFDRATEEFGGEISGEDAGRLLGLDAKLRFLEGAPDDALAVLEGAEEPACVNVRLSIFLEQGDWAGAAAAVEGKPLHERWCDRAVLAHVLSGDAERARQVLAWAKAQADPTTAARCLLTFTQGTLRRLLAARPEAERVLPAACGEQERGTLADTLASLRPLLAVAEAHGRVHGGTEAEALALAIVLARLLGDAVSCARYAALLGTAEPVPIEFARAALRGDVETPPDLPCRLRRDHPELLDAHCLASLLEADRLGKREEAMSGALAQASLATTAAQREHYCSTLLEIAAPAGEAPLARVEEVAVRLLGEAHRFVRFVQAMRCLYAGRTEEVLPLVEGCRAEGDPLWLQLSASLKLLRKDEASALDDLVRASRLLPREEVLERTALLAGKVGQDEVAETALRTLVAVVPRLRRGWAHLAAVSARLGKHAQAAECYRHLGETAPDELSYGLNEAKALALAGRRDESLRVFDAVCLRHPRSLQALGSRAVLLEAMGRPDQALSSLEPARDHFWSDPQFLLLYLSLGYKANREQEAHMAFQRLLELRHAGQDVPLKAFTLEELQVLFRQRHQEQETRNRDLLAGRVPWLLVGRMAGRPPYADWACRTRETIAPDDPQNRVDCTVYATNGWTVRHCGAGERTLEHIAGCPPGGQPVVADLTALLTLHRLGLLGHAAAYFGKIFIPAAYGRLALEDQASLQPHQPSILDALREIRDAADAGRLPPPPRSGQGHTVAPACLDEYEDEGPPCYRMADLVHWLRRQGRITEVQFSAFQTISHKPPAEGMAPVEHVAGAGFITTAFTLRSFATAGLLPPLLQVARLFVPPQDIEDVRAQLRAAAVRDDVARWHRDLWDTVLQDPRFEQMERRRPSAPAEETEEEDADAEIDALLAAPLLAGERGLPLLADDRCFQAILLNGRPAEPHAAFGTDCLLRALAEGGCIGPEETAAHFLQLVRWRYRFLMPPVSALVELASQHRSFPPGEPLCEVSRYVHDCMRDPGLLGGLEPTAPPTSVAWKSYQGWVQQVAGFLVAVWHDDRFDDAAATAITRWAVAELLPSPPRCLPRLGAVVACESTADHVMVTAFTEIWQYRNRPRSSTAVRAIADALGLSREAYLDMVATLVEADLSQPVEVGTEEDTRLARQVLAHTAVAHVGRLHPRSYFALKRLGMLRDTVPGPSADQLAAVANSAHPTRVDAAPGPFVFLHDPATPTAGEAISIPVFLLDPDVRVRETALGFFLQSPQEPDTWLAPRSRAALTEYAEAVRSEAESDWYPAAHRLYEILEDDFLLNLAAFRQARQARLQDEQNATWKRILRPGLTLFASIPEGWYGLPEASAAPACVESVLDGAPSLADALDRYCTRFGHLPLAPAYAAGAVVRRWVEAHGAPDTVWEQVWAWARSSASPFPRYHACHIFLHCPDLVPEGGAEELWDECTVILRFGRNDADPDDPLGLAWRLRASLARHYLGQLELHVPDQHPNRLAALAWWAAERVVMAATESILAEEEEDDRVTQRLQVLLERSLLPEAEFTDPMWGLLRPGTAASSFGFGTMEVPCHWGIALLSAGIPGEGTPVGAVPERAQPDVAVALLGACLTGFPPAVPHPAQTVLAFDIPLGETAARWLGLIGTEDIRSFPQAAAELRRAVEQPGDLLAALRRVAEAPDVERMLVCHTFRATCALGGVDESAIWDLLCDREWTRTCVTTLDVSLLHVLCWGLVEVQRREGGRWHWALPHLFASLAEELEIDVSRRRILCLMAVRSCVVGGTASAVRRLVAGPRSHEFLGFLGEWKLQLEALRRIAPPVVAAFLRDILSSLPPGRETAAEETRETGA